MAEWLRLASRPSVVRRAARYGLGVGLLLIAINHGDAIVRRDVSVGRVFRMIFTMMVPYGVSTATSVGALRELNRLKPLETDRLRVTGGE
jgi:hypothetical protein